jgi:hypothetical protein
LNSSCSTSTLTFDPTGPTVCAGNQRFGSESRGWSSKRESEAGRPVHAILRCVRHLFHKVLDLVLEHAFAVGELADVQ